LNILTADTFTIGGSIAYVAQESWCFNATLRQNVIFGNPFDEKKYRRILNVCALEDDLKQLVNGDETMVGERGVTLSGGQKARIGLARYYFK
jgi:ABC-type multidrug transport system fused ATPase/permease subunit